MFTEHVTTRDLAWKTVLFDKKTLSKKAVVEISAFSFKTLICCYQRTKPSESNLGIMCVAPFGSCPTSYSFEPCFWAKTPGHNSRGVEDHRPRFDLVSFQSVLSVKPTFVSKSRDPNHRLFAF